MHTSISGPLLSGQYANYFTLRTSKEPNNDFFASYAATPISAYQHYWRTNTGVYSDFITARCGSAARRGHAWAHTLTHQDSSLLAALF